ncbi:hypothetical protein BV25DRAFT_1803811 [Artomyces pyxidatus]|uniref:Uncharacterized protein n=1 Tax=Artomyces pyxidatus TaxID=48021 RepID=A0ACB8T2H9_9AGAM|nr:hypothetical protein BV25DRAFT_1803811 [Artomyces pyxidatus]
MARTGPQTAEATAWSEALREYRPSLEDLRADTLVDVVRRCQELADQDQTVDFMLMISRIQLVIHTQSAQASLKLSVREVHNQLCMENKPALRTFHEWIQQGSRFATLAAGGTVYLLMMIANRGMRATIGNLEARTARAVGNLLRCPDAGTLIPRLVRRHIMPVVQKWKESVPLTLAALFTPSVLSEVGVPREALCSDIAISDKFFSNIKQGDFVLLDRSSIWTSESAPSVPVPALTAGPIMAPPVTLYTTYDPQRLQNKRTRTRQDADREEVWEWTEEERTIAGGAYKVQNITELETKLSSFYKEGVRSELDYLLITPEVLPYIRDALKIEAIDASLLAFVCTSMPADMRESLYAMFLSCMDNPDCLKDVDSSSQGFEDHFQALHFSYYNRHCTRGDNAPTDVAPEYLRREGAIRTNRSQLIPYRSKDTTDKEAIYQNFVVVFEEVFAWIDSILARYLPEEYTILEAEIEVLPGNSRSPVHPFGGFVVNLNVTTRAHRDGKDLSVCFVMPLGKFQGGELVLVEPGLVLRLRSGDFVVFPSKKVTHFNMHYKGKRASLVLQTDNELTVWTKDRNGWTAHISSV